MGYPILSEESEIRKVLPVKFGIYLQEEMKACVLFRAAVSLGWGSCAGRAQMTEMLCWWIKDPSKGQVGKGSSRSCPSCGNSRGLWDGRGLRPAWGLSWWLSATGCRSREKMRPSASCKKPRVHRPASSWGISTSSLSARRASQQGTWGACWSAGVANGNPEQLTEQLALRHFAGPQLPRRIRWECERWEQTSGVSMLRDIQNPFGNGCEQPAAADSVLCWEYCPLIHPVKCSFDSLEWNWICNKREVV